MARITDRVVVVGVPIMKRLLLSAAATFSAVAFAPAANAATFITENQGSNGLRTYVFGNNDVGAAGTFDEIISFLTPAAGFLSLSLSEVAVNPINKVEFTSVTLNGTAVNLFSAPGDEPDVGALLSLFNPGTSNTLRVAGTHGRNGMYGGNIAFAPGAVPNPAAWAMMIASFGLVGGALRCQKKVTTSVSFA